MNPDNLAKLETEQRNPHTAQLDMLSTYDLVHTLHEENRTISASVDGALAQLSKLVDVIADRLANGGRLFYIGAGTSGRLGVLDASECPPTFATIPSMVQGVIAGGPKALVSSIEGVEDDCNAGKMDLEQKSLNSTDVVVGIAASGRTPYVIGALDFARTVGATTAVIVNVSDSLLSKHADFVLAAVTGPEPITGSTRMKAGTAQKMLLNLLSTATMVKLGHVFGNLMVNVQPTNEKLRARALRIVKEATGANQLKCTDALERAGWKGKTAIVMLLLDLSADQATKQLGQANGHIRAALKQVKRD